MNIFQKVKSKTRSGYDSVKGFLSDVVWSFWKTIKDAWLTLVNYPEALSILLLAAIGLTQIIASIPSEFIILPVVIESAVLPQMLAIASISILVALMKRRAVKCAEQMKNQ